MRVGEQFINYSKGYTGIVTGISPDGTYQVDWSYISGLFYMKGTLSKDNGGTSPVYTEIKNKPTIIITGE